MSEEDVSCPSTYSPGRAVVMTTPLEFAIESLMRQTGELPPEPSPRTLEALLVQLEQILERLRVAGVDVVRLEGRAEIARHALSSGDVSLASDSLREAAHSISRP